MELEKKEVLKPQKAVQKPNVEFIRDYFDVKAGTKLFISNPKILKDYVKSIS